MYIHTLNWLLFDSLQPPAIQRDPGPDSPLMSPEKPGLKTQVWYRWCFRNPANHLQGFWNDVGGVNYQPWLSSKISETINCTFPSLPNTSWEGVLGMFLGSKYLLGVWKPRVYHVHDGIQPCPTHTRFTHLIGSQLIEYYHGDMPKMSHIVWVAPCPVTVTTRIIQFLVRESL